jgi:molybdopterin-guanine dinucleotide biosynthesis protein
VKEAGTLDQIIATLPQTDLVLVEGFHPEPRAKIEVRSAQHDEPLCPADENLFAVVGPAADNEAVPDFGPDSNEEPRRKQRGIKTATPENLRIILSEASFGEYNPP